jgi:hypothetical protein
METNTYRVAYDTATRCHPTSERNLARLVVSHRLAADAATDPMDVIEHTAKADGYRDRALTIHGEAWWTVFWPLATAAAIA